MRAGGSQIRVIDANKSEKDILLNEELDELQQKSNGRLKVTHILSHPGDDWKGLKGELGVISTTLLKFLFLISGRVLG